MEEQTGSKPGQEYVKAVYCHPASLTYMPSTSWEMPGWMMSQQVTEPIQIQRGRENVLYILMEEIIAGHFCRQLTYILAFLVNALQRRKNSGLFLCVCVCGEGVWWQDKVFLDI